MLAARFGQLGRASPVPAGHAELGKRDCPIKTLLVERVEAGAYAHAVMPGGGEDPPDERP